MWLLLKPIWTCVRALLNSKCLEPLSAFSSCSSPFPPTWKYLSSPTPWHLPPCSRFLHLPLYCQVWLLSPLHQGYVFLVLAVGMLWGKSWEWKGQSGLKQEKPGKSCPSSKVVGCSSLPCSHGITVAWLMGAVRTRTVLRAENRVFGGCSWQTLKPLVSF